MTYKCICTQSRDEAQGGRSQSI